MQIETRGPKEFSPLTDSLTSQIRWRLSDYEAMLRAQVELLLDSNDLDGGLVRSTRGPATRSASVRQ